ncbi:MAG: group II intron reverse transcriptase/maturase [Verrucomicrobiota bacterium]
MTVDLFAGASSHKVSDWEAVNWPQVRHDVRRLQLRIAKAIRARRYGRAKALSWLLTHSRPAKLLAVKRVTENKGAKTPGVDNVIWRTDRQKYAAAQNLKRRGYRPQPLRRIYIPKKNGKLRPLSIPTLHDRAQQALHALALKPIAETIGDRNSYGFREGRSCADANGQCFCALAKSYAPVWVLEGDIKSCFDRISHAWLLKSIPMDKRVLRQWLAAGYWEKGQLFPTNEGTPQGGIISPVLANLTLDGMEQAIRSRIRKRRDQVNFIRYADDFVVTARKREILEQIVKPTVVDFLRQRGLELSEQKTTLTHIETGFNFLGQNVRKYRNKLVIKPAKDGWKTLVQKTRECIKGLLGQTAETLIRKLNPILRGWANCHRCVCSAKAFWTVDRIIHYQLLRWAQRTHPNKSYGWLKRKYFTAGGRFGFAVRLGASTGESHVLRLYSIARTVLERHIKVRGEANPYDPSYTEYFERRRCFAWRTLPCKRTGKLVLAGV